MNQSLPALLASIVTFAIGAAVALREPQRSRRLFSVFSLAVATWLIATFVHSTMGWEAAHVVALSVALPIPIVAYRFFAVFVTQIAGETDAPQRPLVTPRWMIPVAAALLVPLVYTALFGSFSLHHAPLFTVLYATYIYGGLAATALLARGAYRRTLGRTEKARLSYLYVGGLIAIALSLYDGVAAYLAGRGTHLPTTGYVFTVTYMYFLSQALFRYRLLDLNELLGRMSVLAAFVFLLSTIYGLLVAWVPSNQSGLFFFNSIVASLVIFILFEPLRGVIEGQIQGWLFRERWALKAEIDRARTELVNTIDLPDAVAVTLRHLEESHRVTNASVYLLDRDGAGYDLYGAIGPRPVERIDAAARRLFFERLQAKTGPFATFAPISIEQLEREVEALSVGETDTEALDGIARTLDEMRAALCLPLVVVEDQHAQIVGLLSLRDERLRDAFASEEIELLRGLAGQLAISVKNSNLYERMKERDRLAALGEMAAGLAHEIRNPLGAIKGAAQLLLPASGAPAGDAEFLTIIVEETNRLNRVVSQFLDYARPYKGALDVLDVNDVVRRTVQLLPPSTDEAPQPDVALELGEQLPVARGDAEQLRQVFLNLGLNALQSMPDGGRLSIATLVRPARGGSPPLLEVRFRDTGKGIPTQLLKSLFIPFFTTREGGTGLGLPISQRIVENHGGRIEVRSREGTGSTFSVLLPVQQAV